MTEFGVAQLAVEGRCHMPEDRMPGLDNRRKDTRAQDLLDGLANPGGAVVGGHGVKGHAPRLLAAARRCNKIVDPAAKLAAGVDLQHTAPGPPP